jgi:hypothetical protein
LVAPLAAELVSHDANPQRGKHSEQRDNGHGPFNKAEGQGQVSTRMKRRKDRPRDADKMAEPSAS